MEFVLIGSLVQTYQNCAGATRPEL